jgi:protein-S-isoprenylcysteine O-methyltransferase Ste14
MSWCVLIVSWAIVGQHIWATRDHFVSEKMAPGAMLLAALVIGSTLVFSALTLIVGRPASLAVVGLVIELLSLTLFWAAIVASRRARLLFAFDPGLPHGLLDTGPYRYVRHPFYTSYLLFWIGWAVAIWSVWTLPFVVLLIAFYVAAATGEERKFAATQLGPEYELYRQRAGLFWPKLPVMAQPRSVRE